MFLQLLLGPIPESFGLFRVLCIGPKSCVLSDRRVIRATLHLRARRHIQLIHCTGLRGCRYHICQTTNNCGSPRMAFLIWLFHCSIDGAWMQCRALDEGLAFCQRCCEENVGKLGLSITNPCALASHVRPDVLICYSRRWCYLVTPRLIQRRS